ncbi:MAG: tetratricopeptide repeat protein [Pseudomonadota bacterium]
MNLFARILSHGFALAVVVLLALGLIYRGELFPEWKLPEYLVPGHQQLASDSDRMAAAGSASAETPATESSDAEAVPPAFMSPPPPPPPAPSGAGLGSGAELAAPEVAATEDAVPPEAATAPPTAAAEAVPTPAAESAAAPPEDVGAPPETAAVPAATAAGGEAPEVPAMPAAGETSAAAPAASVAKPAASAPATPYRLLAAAREAYWLRDYAAAEEKYQALIALDPDNPDGYGELGNMYFSQGDWDKASAAYFEAGARLANQGHLERARQMAEVIHGLNGGQAGELEQLINAAEAATPR